MIDKAGRDAVEFTTLPGGGRVPVMTTDHRDAMVQDLYRAGWSFRLIAQFGHLDTETALTALNRRLDSS
jgi:hypothetical protein